MEDDYQNAGNNGKKEQIIGLNFTSAKALCFLQ
jgi:hypothetical protein